MSTYTSTQTNTYTIVDIRKTFEGFAADLRMIARRTGKWTTEYVDDVIYDVVTLAEYKYLEKIDITLLEVGIPIRACKYSINEAGNALNGDRAGGNDWPNIIGSHLQVIVSYTSAWHRLTSDAKQKFYSDNGFKIKWITSEIDTSYSHLRQEQAQLYASKGYELSKQNFK